VHLGLDLFLGIDNWFFQLRRDVLRPRDQSGGQHEDQGTHRTFRIA